MSIVDTSYFWPCLIRTIVYPMWLLPCQPKLLGGEILTIKQGADYLTMTERMLYRLAQRWGMGL